jgi:hypothetical protein
MSAMQRMKKPVLRFVSAGPVGPEGHSQILFRVDALFAAQPCAEQHELCLLPHPGRLERQKPARSGSASTLIRWT